MDETQRQMLINFVVNHARGMISKHLANVEIYLANPVGIGEHSDVMGAIEMELDNVAKYSDRVDVLVKYVKNVPEIILDPFDEGIIGPH